MPIYIDQEKCSVGCFVQFKKPVTVTRAIPKVCPLTILKGTKGVLLAITEDNGVWEGGVRVYLPFKERGVIRHRHIRFSVPLSDLEIGRKYCDYRQS